MNTYLSVKAALKNLKQLPYIGTVQSEPGVGLRSVQYALSDVKNRTKRRSQPARKLRNSIIEALRSAGANGVFAVSGPLTSRVSLSE